MHLSSHNLAKLDDTICEIEQEAFALDLLMDFDLSSSKRKINFWYGLIDHHINLLGQYVSDLRNLDSCIRSGKDFDADPCDDLSDQEVSDA